MLCCDETAYTYFGNWDFPTRGTRGLLYPACRSYTHSYTRCDETAFPISNIRSCSMHAQMRMHTVHTHRLKDSFFHFFFSSFFSGKIYFSLSVVYYIYVFCVCQRLFSRFLSSHHTHTHSQRIITDIDIIIVVILNPPGCDYYYHYNNYYPPR